MEDLKVPKWIVERLEDWTLMFKLGLVNFHWKLASNKENVLGGGWYQFDSKTNSFYLYDKSLDFGRCKIEDIRKAKEDNWIQGSLRKADWYFNDVYDTKHEVDYMGTWEKV